MNIKHTLGILLLAICAFAQSDKTGAQTNEPTSQGRGAYTFEHPAPASIADFIFMTGRWIGKLPNGAVAEQICSAIRQKQMMCEFRLSDTRQWVMFEFYALRETPNGVELDGRVFDPDLAIGKEETRLVLRPVEVSKGHVLFLAAPGDAVKSSELTLSGTDSMHGHVAHSGGAVDVEWKRTPYDANVD